MEEAKRQRLVSKILVGGLCLYAAVMLALALDQILGPVIYPPPLDRTLRRKIAALADPALTAERRENLRRDIIGYHEFSIPLLIEAVEGKPEVRREAVRCLQAIAERFFNQDISDLDSDPGKLKAWWRGLKGKLDAAAPR